LQQYCEKKFGITFSFMDEIEVNGKNTHPLYQYLKSHAKGFLHKNIKWNFTKFLLCENLETIKRYSSVNKSHKIEQDIKSLLNKLD